MVSKRRYLATAGAGATLILSGCMGTLEDDAPEEENENQFDDFEHWDSQREIVDEYASFERRVTNGIEDHERGQELIDSEEYLAAEERFRDAERELDQTIDDFTDFRVDISLEFGSSSDISELLDSISTYAIAHESAAGVAKEGAQELADGGFGSGYIDAARELIEEKEEVEIPTKMEFDNMLYDE